MINGEQVRLIREVNDRQKESFLGGALALLFSIEWPEPFGVVCSSLTCQFQHLLKRGPRLGRYGMSVPFKPERKLFQIQAALNL